MSDVDLFVVSDKLSYADAFTALEVVGNKLGRSVNPTIITVKELAKRIKQDSAFVTRVLSQPKLWLIGGEDDLTV